MRRGRRIVALALACLLAVLAWPAREAPVEAAAPGLNVVLLVVDDIRWDSIGAAGNRVVRTPRLDRIAAEGVRFEQARVTTAICMVSRATLLTGQYMSRHGVTAFGRPLSPEAFAETWPGVLRRAGYWTGLVGKYDVGPARASDFDVLHAYHGRHWIEGPDGTRTHVTERNREDALAFLRDRPRDRRFALTVGFFAPHAEDNAKDQYLPQPWSAAAYEGVTIPAPRHGDPAYLRALPPFLSAEANEGRVRYHWRFDTPADYQAYMRRYYRLITEVDAAIGAIVDLLRAQGELERTMIVVIGDNGYFHGDRGLADKWYPYEEALRVPLLVRDPRLPRARRGGAPGARVLNLDVAPTLVAAAGLPVPARMQGRDMAPLYLQARPPAWRDAFFYEHPTITSRDRIPSSVGVIGSAWKYVEYPEHGHRQLFSLRDDPDELHDLARDPAHAGRVASMAAELEAWRARAR
ncbi:acetylglucosamine-6-sulfatase [Luteitalea sp. TBR-22]|uniref:sulfatase-like hydrolase/transferase n=1 Tax=Luteitalea sp. TBR-22 TaxID=2802971 RepID=UPI001EF72E1C|nr:sulfatase-like hydrolase/transferase [Luteitalea sp. TBR-22]BCS31766.2 acetylglucosamine-6-sulfatase [Luteitalea sp. TBR-22]